MFVRTVAPSMERTYSKEIAKEAPAEEGTKMSNLGESTTSAAEEMHPSIPDPCDFRACQLYRVIKYPVIVMNFCGVFVPSYCICQSNLASRQGQDQGTNESKADQSSSKHPNHLEDVEFNGGSSKANSLFYAEASPLPSTRTAEDGEVVVARGKKAAHNQHVSETSTLHIESCDSQRSCKNSDRRWWGLVKRIGCVTMCTCHSINSVRYAFILREASQETSQLIFSMAMFFILSTYFYLMAFNSFACRSHFSLFISSARKFELDFSGFRTNFTRLSRIHGAVFVIGFINQSLNATIFMYGVLHSFGGVSPQMWPFKDLTGGWRLLLALVVGFSVFSAGANQYGANIFRTVVTDIVENEFKGLRRSLKTILSRAATKPSAQTQTSQTRQYDCLPAPGVSSSSTLLVKRQATLKTGCTLQDPSLDQDSLEISPELELDNFLAKFRAVCGLLDQGYHLTKHTVAAAYVFGVPTLCVLVYGLVSSSVTRDQWVVLSLNVIVAGAVLAHTTWTLARLGTTADSVCDVVYDADWSKFSQSFLQKMVLFTTMFSKKRFGITVYGLFRIEWSTLLVLGSSLLVYSIVIIQFQLGTHTAICHFGNFTQ
ncbi:hypothetical protein PoB_003969200 [Plakobranchus ocellatus]|uniref:Gustatory receptor n=1 Tax=Plakobranchus ocellatus TaxID=259542 RepID=A0AAV4B255_9GAST|nr:hypothetical protein PoB_003969200 [Plakobranchus ocellatus]